MTDYRALAALDGLSQKIAEAAEVAGGDAAGAPLTVLVVDDDAAVARFVASALWRMGIADVRIAHDGNEALEADVGAGSGIGLVVTDLQMPELDGIAFLRHLATRGYTGAVLLMSGADERLLKAVEGLARSLDLNVLGVLSKPVHPADLAKAVRRVRAPAEGLPAPEVEVSVDELRAGLAAGEIEPEVRAESRREDAEGRRRRGSRRAGGTRPRAS